MSEKTPLKAFPLLSARTRNTLAYAGIEYKEDLLTLSDAQLRRIDLIGPKSVAEIRRLFGYPWQQIDSGNLPPPPDDKVISGLRRSVLSLLKQLDEVEAAYLRAKHPQPQNDEKPLTH